MGRNSEGRERRCQRPPLDLNFPPADEMEPNSNEAPEFWREHRDAIIQDSILTRNQTEYPSRMLSLKLSDLERADAQTTSTYKSMLRIRKKYKELGTFKC